MKTSVGYTVILNIVIIFIVIIFGVIAMCLSYYRSFKVSNVITHSIEKYEGYNYLAENEIVSKISALGYGSTSVKCPQTRSSCTLVKSGENSIQYSEGKLGYCVYECPLNDDQYYYKTTTNMLMNIPFINNILNIPVESNSRKLYGFNKIVYNKDENNEKISCSPKSGKGSYSIGTEFNCVNIPNCEDTWYLLEDGGTTVSLIYSKNIENIFYSNWKYNGYETATIGLSLFISGFIYDEDINSHVIVSLPQKEQLRKVCNEPCSDGRFTSCGEEGNFLKTNLDSNVKGYWAQETEGNDAWNIDYVPEEQNNCELDLDAKNTTAPIGIRPVITLPKSSIIIK